MHLVKTTTSIESTKLNRGESGAHNAMCKRIMSCWVCAISANMIDPIHNNGYYRRYPHTQYKTCQCKCKEERKGIIIPIFIWWKIRHHRKEERPRKKKIPGFECCFEHVKTMTSHVRSWSLTPKTSKQHKTKFVSKCSDTTVKSILLNNRQSKVKER